LIQTRLTKKGEIRFAGAKEYRRRGGEGNFRRGERVLIRVGYKAKGGGGLKPQNRLNVLNKGSGRVRKKSCRRRGEKKDPFPIPHTRIAEKKM